jgi:TetR/AcrR family fatty acid metabolism transcriptional regulator
MTGTIQAQIIEARRNQILDAATIVFAEKGFHPTTIKDIAKVAGIADGTIYNYFKNKSALLIGIFDRMRASAIEGIVLPTIDDIEPRLFISTFLNHSLLSFREGNFPLFRVIVSEMMVNEELRVLYYQQILMPTLALAEGYFMQLGARKNIPPEQISLTIRAISGMVMGLIMQNIMNDPLIAQKWDELPDFLTDLLLNGLGDLLA